jgi:hypothetical protein
MCELPQAEDVTSIKEDMKQMKETQQKLFALLEPQMNSPMMRIMTSALAATTAMLPPPPASVAPSEPTGDIPDDNKAGEADTSQVTSEVPERPPETAAPADPAEAEPFEGDVVRGCAHT